MTASPEDSKQGVLMQTQAAPASPTQQQQQRTPSPAGISTPPPNNEARKISCEDIQLVQNLIERCLQLYMNQTKVIFTLKMQAKIEPSFTSLVWQKLEEQNPDFFKAYYTRLKVKKQIILFNHLLEMQAQLLEKMHICPQPNMMVQQMQNVHHMPMDYSMPAGPPNAVMPHMGAMPIQVSNANIMNGASPVQEYSPSHGSPGSAPMFPFSNMGHPTDITGMQMGLTTSMGLDTPFISNDPGQNGIGPLAMSPTEVDSKSTRESLESLGHLPRNFSLSDLTADFSSARELGALGNYTGSPFVGPDTESYIQSPETGFSEDDKMLDTMGSE